MAGGGSAPTRPPVGPENGDASGVESSEWRGVAVADGGSGHGLLSISRHRKWYFGWLWETVSMTAIEPLEQVVAKKSQAVNDWRELGILHCLAC